MPFAGWAMPVLYQDSLMESTKHCRENASIFDVSHMCGATFKVLAKYGLVLASCHWR